MKNFIPKLKNKFYINILKILGVCGVLILFEACYGTPKSAWVQSNKNPDSTKAAKSIPPVDITSNKNIEK